MAGQWKDVELTGSVVAVDVQERTFRMRIDDIGNVSAPFTEEQGYNVIAALTDHDHVRVRVCGRGEFTAQGALKQISDVASLRIVPKGPAADPAAPRLPIEDKIAMNFKNVPAEEWSKLPHDLIENLDHYLYGTDKR